MNVQEENVFIIIKIQTKDIFVAISRDGGLRHVKKMIMRRKSKMKLTCLDGLKNWLYFFHIKHDIWESEYIKGHICVQIEGLSEIIVFDKMGQLLYFE